MVRILFVCPTFCYIKYDFKTQNFRCKPPLVYVTKAICI